MNVGNSFHFGLDGEVGFAFDGEPFALDFFGRLIDDRFEFTVSGVDFFAGSESDSSTTMPSFHRGDFSSFGSGSKARC